MRIFGWAAVATLLVACSSGGGKSDAGTGGGACPTAYSANSCVDGCNPCTRLSDAQVAAAIGLPPVTGQWDGDACLWDFYEGGNLSIEVSFQVNTDYGTFELECQAPSTPDGGISITPVDGVGDQACFLGTSGTLGAFDINFLKGCFAYAISIVGPLGQPPPFPTATLQADEKALALDAVQNL